MSGRRYPTETRSRMCSRKRRFKSRKAAEQAITTIRTRGEKRRRTPTRAYPCPACNGWHVAGEVE